MTNYSLAEFREWLEADPARRADWPMSSWNNFLHKGTGNYFECLIEMKDYNETWQFSRLRTEDYKGVRKYHQVVMKWIAERERERGK